MSNWSTPAPSAWTPVSTPPLCGTGCDVRITIAGRSWEQRGGPFWFSPADGYWYRVDPPTRGRRLLGTVTHWRTHAESPAA